MAKKMSNLKKNIILSNSPFKFSDLLTLEQPTVARKILNMTEQLLLYQQALLWPVRRVKKVVHPQKKLFAISSVRLSVFP